MDESVEAIDDVKYEKLGSNNEKLITINGSDEGVKVFDDDVSLMDKPNDVPISESGNSPSSVGTSKGKGLRKWRRIRRDVVKDGSGGVDSGKSGKRGLSSSAPNPIRGQKTEASLSSTGAVGRNLANEINGSILYPKLEISEDQSSISSTAAGGSVLRNKPATVAVTSEKKGVNGVKARAKSKKARGETEKIEKENLITSSLESDSRSSNFVFLQGADYVANNGNGTQNHVDENGDDEGREGDKCVDDEVEAGISKENRGDFEDLTDDGENRGSAPELDPLAESISNLQSAQEALEKEIQKLRELGDETQRTTEEDMRDVSSSQLFNLRQTAEISPHYSKAHANTLEQDVDKLKYEEIEAEIEELFRCKLEDELQYLVISKAVQKLKTNVVDQVPISDEIKSTLNVVRDVENNVSILKRRDEKLETRVEETVETDEVSKLQKRVRQVTSCLIIQFILLFLLVVSFVLNLSPDNAEVVPT